jgi:hypothetical protein
MHRCNLWATLIDCYVLLSPLDWPQLGCLPMLGCPLPKVTAAVAVVSAVAVAAVSAVAVAAVSAVAVAVSAAEAAEALAGDLTA